MREDKEKLGEYTVDSSVWVGTNRLVFGIDEDEMCSFIAAKGENSDIGMYYTTWKFTDYISAITFFADMIKKVATELEERRDNIGLDDASCLDTDDVKKITASDDLNGKVVALKEKSLAFGFRDISNQLYYVVGGFGASPNSRGNACFVWDLYGLKMTRIDRTNILGIVPDEKLPDFAKQTLNDIQSGKLKEKRDREER